jgi:hypothetical protein
MKKIKPQKPVSVINEINNEVLRCESERRKKLQKKLNGLRQHKA